MRMAAVGGHLCKHHRAKQSSAPGSRSPPTIELRLLNPRR